MSFNFMSFYRESALTNYSLIIFIDLYFLYVIFLVFLNSSNFSLDILSITKFIHNEHVMDCFSDKNQLYLLGVLVFDLVGTFLFNFITMLIFQRYLNK